MDRIIKDKEMSFFQNKLDVIVRARGCRGDPGVNEAG